MAAIPDSVRHKFKRIIEESKGDYRFKKILSEGKDENFRWAYQFAYERAYGKPLQNVDMQVNDITERPDAETLNEALRSLENHSNGNGLEKGK